MEWLIGAVAAATGLALAYAALDRVTDRPRQAVLPAHYDPTNYATDPSSIPGRCAPAVGRETIPTPATAGTARRSFRTPIPSRRETGAGRSAASDTAAVPL